MNRSESEAQHLLDAANAWLDLGNWQEAHAELTRLPIHMLGTPHVMELWCCVYAEAEHWANVEQIAQTAAATYPDNQKFPISLAWARHEQRDTVGGLSIAEQAAERFPKSASAAYTAACLCGALARIEEAWKWLSLAFERAPDPDRLRLEALDVPELVDVWRAADNEG